MKNSIKYALLFLSFFIGFNFFQINESIGKVKNKKEKRKKKNNKKNKKKRKEELKDKFKDIKEFKSYDPATKKWSKIEKFETVEVVEGEPKTKKEDYIYQGFWAFDPKSDKWYKVNIANFNYIPKKQPFWSRIGKNFAFDIGYGGEIGYHQMFASGKSISITNSFTSEYYISDKIGYQDQFTVSFLSLSKVSRRSLREYIANTGNSIAKVSIAQIAGYDFMIPLTAHLHYTFDKPRIRLGLGITVALSFLDKLKVLFHNGKYGKSISRKRKANRKSPFEKSPNIILKPFFSFGWILNSSLINLCLLDMRTGCAYYMSQRKKGSFLGVMTDLGFSYERRMGNYMRFFTRVSSGFQFSTIQKLKARRKNPKTDGALYSMILPSFGIQIGFGTYFAKDKDVDDSFIELYNYRKKVRESRLKNRKKSRRSYKR